MSVVGGYVGIRKTNIIDGGAFRISSQSGHLRLQEVISGPVVEDFESGSLGDKWKNVTDFAVSTSTVWEGTYSGVISGTSNTPVASWEVPVLKYSKIRWKVYMGSGSAGHAVVIRDSNGNYIIGVKSENPQQFTQVDDNNGWTERGVTSNEDVWSEVEIAFDWNNGTFTFKFTRFDTDETTEIAGLTMGSTTDIAAFDFIPGRISDNKWTGPLGTTSGSNNVFFDLLELIP